MASFSDRIREYSATPSGKIVVVAVPVAVLVLIVAVVVLTMLNPGPQQAGDLKPIESTGTVGTEATPAAEATGKLTSETTEPPVNKDYEVYETRDPFKRADSTTTPSSTGGASSSSSNSSTSTSSGGQQSNVLSLKSISNQNGVFYANVEYGTGSYVVRAGERVGASPYQITSVGSDSAAFLYGDDTLTLGVGEDVQK